MIARNDLEKIAQARLRDAVVLQRSKRYDGAVYLCGYAVEIALKARISRTLRWSGFPETAKEFEGLRSLQTHSFDVLLRFSGIESRIKTGHMTAWSIVGNWSPDTRYRAIGTATATNAADMIVATRELLRVLL